MAKDVFIKEGTFMDHFELVSEYAPTGFSKTFTMANVITQLNKPTLILAYNKTLAT